MSAHSRSIRREFAKQAEGWSSYTSDVGLLWVLENLDLEPNWRVLDVAAGTGVMARGLSPFVGRVDAVDLTPEMIAQGQREAIEQGTSNVTFIEAPAEKLPLPDESYDLVVTRLSVHHFEQPLVVLREINRVCRAKGTVVVIDMVPDEDPSKAAAQNKWERVRDSSHVRCLSLVELTELVTSVGLELMDTEYSEHSVELEAWMERTKMTPDKRELVRIEMAQELNGLSLTGMDPRQRDGGVLITQRFAVIAARKA